MTRIGIVGGGMAATMHAEAVLHSRAATLSGVGGRDGTGNTLAAAAAAPCLGLEALIDSSDALVIATPAHAVAEIIESIGDRVRALLVESPLPRQLPAPTIPAMVGANLLHSPTVRQGLSAIAELTPHHLELRSTQPQPRQHVEGAPAVGGPLLDPGARLFPVLLAAAGSPVVSAERRDPGPHGDQEIEVTLADGRRVVMRSTWMEGHAFGELEAADANGVVQISFFPIPHLEMDGRSITPAEIPPVRSLGFVDQIERLARVAEGDTEPWLPWASGQGIRALLEESAS